MTWNLSSPTCLFSDKNTEAQRGEMLKHTDSQWKLNQKTTCRKKKKSCKETKQNVFLAVIFGVGTMIDFSSFGFSELSKSSVEKNYFL